MALHQVRTFSQHVFGGFRDKDRQAQAALEARFFPGLSAAELAPLRQAPG